MLYIFQVDTGQMLCFEMDVAISTVNTLKSKIATTHGIPIDKQVLLVSGGEILDGGSRVCNYAAGTDTNPIFLFNKLNIEVLGPVQQPDFSGVGNYAGGGVGESVSSGNVQMADLETIQREVEQANNHAPTYAAVVTRTQLAQHICDMGKEITRKCEVLIHHQHLQHQGWAAVIANLDDIEGLFNSKLNAFVAAYEGFCKEYLPEHINSFVDGLESTLKALDSIKIPTYYRDATSPNQQQQHSVVTWLSEHYTSHPSTPASINSSTPLYAHLYSTATSTRKTYDHMTCDNFLETLQKEAAAAIDQTLAAKMKEIKGLEPRLYGLDQLLQGAKKIVHDQNELTQAFHQNVSRASDLQDPSIFPDLCASHQHQLLVMYKNHCQLDDIKNRVSKAKEELTVNINQRLQWVAYVQRNLSEMGGKIGVYHESLRRLRINVNVLQQVSECERVYAAYVDEVKSRGRVGRKLGKLAEKISEWGRICSVENARRTEFIDTYGRHFLSQAFSVLIEDREVVKIAVPQLFEYVGGDSDEDDDERVVCDAEKIELRGKVKELEGVIAGLNSSKNAVEVQLGERNKLLEVERERARNGVVEVESARADAVKERGKVEKLAAQVEDLKRLIDEFRVKEDDNIRARELEISECNARLQEEKSKCNERVVELTRMLEFECAQKIKDIEESHRMELVAMVKRFKLVNECSNQAQKLQRDQSSSSTAAPVSPITGGRGRITSESDNNASARSVFASSREIVFSDDEDSDVAGGGGRNRTDSIRMEEEDPEDQTSSLERAQDAMLLHHDHETTSSTTTATAASGSDFGDSEKVVRIAQRLHSLSRISVSACRVGGDANLFYWNERYNAFTVYLSNRNVHFLNTSERGSSSVDDEHGVVKGMSKSNVFVANITDKEFCVARRAQNRYNVPQGFHFYRVKISSEKLEIYQE